MKSAAFVVIQAVTVTSCKTGRASLYFFENDRISENPISVMLFDMADVIWEISGSDVITIHKNRHGPIGVMFQPVAEEFIVPNVSRLDYNQVEQKLRELAEKSEQ
jgi:hypothetical protein